MNIVVSAANEGLEKLKDKALLIGFLKDNLQLKGEIKAFDSKFGNVISNFISNSSFKGDKGETKSIFLNKDIQNIIIVGLGEVKNYGIDVLSHVVADVSKRLRDSGIDTFSIHMDSFMNDSFSKEEAVHNLTMSITMGSYNFHEYKTKDRDKIKFIKEVKIVASGNFSKEIEKASVIADAVNKTRDLVNTPPNVASPEYVANYATTLAKESGIKCTVLDENQIKKLRMECFLAVAKGSHLEPKLLVLEYNGDKSKKPIALVGKGVTFDSGGLNLKPFPFMCNMKDDKGGAVALIHVIAACAKLKLPVNLIVITPLCENMPSGTSFRPDDVLKAYNGMTVEIKNTDAEGRLILADALSYAAEKKPQAIIDVASLTGASFIVLGTAGTPFVCTDENLSKRIKDASAKSLEKTWEMPLWQEYEESLKSEIADVKHIGDEGEAGVLTAAMFLKNFVADVPWIHIDIGTTVWSKVDKGILTKGATGATVRLLIEALSDWK